MRLTASAKAVSSLSTIAGIIAKQWRKTREVQIEAHLKAELIKQNRSAEEIERILQVTSRGLQPAEEE